MIRSLPAVLLSITLATAARAQEAPKPPAPAASAPSPEQMARAMSAGVNAVGPAIAKMQDAMLESALHTAEQPETARRLAVFKKNLYDALVQQGFTKPQALEITMNTQLPTIGK